MKTRLFLTISFLCAFTLTSLAQEKMKILLKNGSAIDYFVEDIEEVSFETDAEEDEPSSGPLQLKMNATSFKHKGFCEPIIETITAEQMNHIIYVSKLLTVVPFRLMFPRKNLPKSISLLRVLYIMGNKFFLLLWEQTIMSHTIQMFL